VQIDLLGLVPHTSSGTYFGIYTQSNYTFTDGIAGTGYLSTGGTGATALGTFLPTVRYFYFNVSGACTVKVWARSGGATVRSLFLTDGSIQIATVSSAGATNDPVILTGNVSADQAAAGKIYLYGDNNFRIYKIEVTTANVVTPALGTNTFNKESDVTVYSNNNKVFFSNIKSKTNVAIYSLTGALVKSEDVNEDSGLSVENGVYIVKLKSAEGEKTVKVIVQ
jgi:hypothetical protein